jgi:acylphosphatase
MKHSGAKRWLISGRVQGVGFGWTRNLDDGRVEAYAVGPPEKLSDLAAALHAGPRMADVRSVEEMEDVVQKLRGFSVR